MQNELAADIAAIQAISAVPTILETVSAMTGMRFVCVARVTCDSWTTCAVLDKLNFGLKVGDGLDVATTLCNEVRDTQKAIVIDKVSEDPAYCNHHTPRTYGFESYFSIPLYRPDGEYFGTLCGIDPLPAKLSTPSVFSSMTLFAQLISLQLENERKQVEMHKALLNERETAELREQFIAVLGHDVRNPLCAILTGTETLLQKSLPSKTKSVVELIESSAWRISSLIDDVVDFARGRMGGGIPLKLQYEPELHTLFAKVIEELQSAYTDRVIHADLSPDIELLCDRVRMAQLLSNLLKNALVHGDLRQPVYVSTKAENGHFELTVSNHGPVLAKDKITQLFKPFWRGSKANDHQGLGLGLFIVSEIVHAHRGQIEVISEDGLTSFIFRVNDPACLGKQAECA
jgi:signal transduction histidine kinase